MYFINITLAIAMNILENFKSGCTYRAYNNIICTDDKTVVADADDQKRLVNLRFFIINDD